MLRDNGMVLSVGVKIYLKYASTCWVEKELLSQMMNTRSPIRGLKDGEA